MRKTHFAVKPPFDLTFTSACGLGDQRSRTENPFNVTCNRCQNNDKFILALDEAKSARHAALMAQTPVEVINIWTKAKMVCSDCGNDKFRDKGRDLWTYWFMCGKCGKNQGYPTETGMCQ